MRIFYTLCFLLILTACEKNESVNQAPKSFTVSVSEVTTTSAKINWTVATDPENESISYAIELNGQSVSSGISGTQFTFESLTEGGNYAGKVIAKDASGNTTSSSFNFSTSNSPSPSTFTVSLFKASYKTVELIWSASTLPDGGVVTYDVFVNDVLKTSGLSTLNYLISGLQPLTQYNFKVVAKSAAGKSKESTFQSSTIANQAPEAFTINLGETGATVLNFEGTIPIDPEQELLTYFVVVDGVEKQFTPTIISSTTFKAHINGLTSNKNYDIVVKVKDEGGAFVNSNIVSITTQHSPENNFSITAVGEGTKVAVEFITSSQLKINTANSQYLVGTNWKNFGGTSLTYTDLPENKVKVKILIDDAELRQLVNAKLQLNLNWAIENANTQSAQVQYTHFAPTTARVSNAIIKGPGTFPSQWTLNFENCVISEYATWVVEAIVFDNVQFDNYTGFGICDPFKIGYYTGNATDAEYTYLKTKSTGYIMVKDAGGFHKIDFTYTWQD